MSYVSTFPGLGASATQYVSAGGSIASPVVGALGGGSLAAATGLSASLAIPIVGAAFAGVLLGIEAILNSGCGQTCVVTSQWANQAAAQLDRMIKAYFSVPVPRPQSLQQGCMNLFQQVWAQLVANCSQPNLGTAGQNCISDRQDGACKWKASPPAYPGEPAAGQCWNWWNGYYWPIANDPDVVPDSQLQTQTNNAQSNTSAPGAATSPAPAGIPLWVWLLGGAGAIAYAVS